MTRSRSVLSVLAVTLAMLPVSIASAEAVDALKLTISADKTDLAMTPLNLRRATADTPHYAVEKTKLTFTFTNVSDKPVKLNTYDVIWSRLALSVTGPNQKSVKVEEELVKRAMLPPQELDFPILQPKESWTCEATFPYDFGRKTYYLMEPGEYRVKVTYHVPVEFLDRGIAPPKYMEGMWIGSVTSNEVVFKAAVAGEKPAADSGKERAEKLKVDLDSFALGLRYYGPQDKPFYILTLSVQAIPRRKSTPFMLDAVIDKETASKIIDRLLDAGILARADEVPRNRLDRLRKAPDGPCYVLTVEGNKLELEDNLGWGPDLAKQLLALRVLVKDDAAKQMDVFLGRLSGSFKEWTGKPYAPPKGKDKP
jgi:hypothetical protein